jgi:hypothetical protein
MAKPIPPPPRSMRSTPRPRSLAQLDHAVDDLQRELTALVESPVWDRKLAELREHVDQQIELMRRDIARLRDAVALLEGGA